MGCFSGEREKEKHRKKAPSEHSATAKIINLYDNKPAILPRPSSSPGGSVSFSSKVRTIQHVNRLINNNSHSHTPKPLPLPPDNSVVEGLSPRCGWGAKAAHPEPKPLPPPRDHMPALQTFTYEEISAACNCFSEERCMSEASGRHVYQASFHIEGTVTRFLGCSQSYKEFLTEVNTMASLHHPHLCKLMGFHARETGDRMLVYERLPRGSLDRLLYMNYYGIGLSQPIMWCTRMKIALGAAQGLAYLHEEGPFQAMYSDFKASNIQIDEHFNPKLSEYGFASCNPKAQVPCCSSRATAYLAPETLARGLLTPKSNVWSFGIMLLELLTGLQNMGACHPHDERDLVKWCVPFLTEESRLVQVLDPRLDTSCSSTVEAAKSVAALALNCLQMEPSDRPTMRAIVEILESFPLLDKRRLSVFPSSPLIELTWLPAIPQESFSVC
uniref:Protein kinase domain-containing protein n=1 Tax=Araucaria cunninghamii TaxID=56994 RepID=A0A0D6R6V2_ARACU